MELTIPFSVALFSTKASLPSIHPFTLLFIHYLGESLLGYSEEAPPQMCSSPGRAQNVSWGTDAMGHSGGGGDGDGDNANYGAAAGGGAGGSGAAGGGSAHSYWALTRCWPAISASCMSAHWAPQTALQGTEILRNSP